MATELAQAIQATPFDADAVLSLIEVDYSKVVTPFGLGSNYFSQKDCVNASREPSKVS